MGDLAQLPMFTVRAVDPPLRDNRDAMELPFLSLQKGRKLPIEFAGRIKDRDVYVSVAADVRATIATIWDWDLIIFAASHLNDAIEAGLKPSSRIRFVPHDALKQIGRGTGGKDYKELAQTIRRLRLTTVITNIREEDGAGAEKPFSWLTDYSIPKRYSRTPMTADNHEGTPDPARPWEIELPDWLFNSILRRTGILAVHPDYFDLTGGLERWLYRVARKAVPDKADVKAIKFRMQTLHERSGTTRPLRNFAVDIRRLAEADTLPEYGLRIEKDGRNELVILYRDNFKPTRLPRGMKKLQIDTGSRKDFIAKVRRISKKAAQPADTSNYDPSVVEQLKVKQRILSELGQADLINRRTRRKTH